MLTFRQWYRILREHNHFTIYESLKFALWLANPRVIRLTKLGNGYCGIALSKAKSKIAVLMLSLYVLAIGWTWLILANIYVR